MRILKKRSYAGLWLLLAPAVFLGRAQGAPPRINLTAPAGATTLTGPISKTTVNIGACNNAAGVQIGTSCTDTAEVYDLVAGTNSVFINPGFFNSPNGKQPTEETALSTIKAGLPAGWTLVNGGTLDVTLGVSYNLSNADEFDSEVGGMEISANVTSYNPAGNRLAPGVAAPSASQLVWTQALYINYQPGNAGTTPNNPANTLDDYTFNTGGTGKAQKQMGPFGMNATPLPTPKGGTKKGRYTPVPPNIAANPDNQRSYADPIYPFQTPGAAGGPGVNGFYDGPQGYYQTPASFRGIALLSAVNTTTKTLTVFNDGIDYGFDLAVMNPEPSFMLVSSMLSLVMFIVHRRRRTCS